MNILAFLKSLIYLFHKPYQTGIIADTRTDEEKEKDYLHEEIASAAVPFYGNTKITVNPYYAENQNQTSSCVAHGTTFSLEMAWKKINGLWTRLSKAFVYRQRSNYPQEGMWQQNAYQIEKDNGSCLFETLPTPYSEAEINSINITQGQRDEAAKHKGLEYVRILSYNDIDAICAVAEQGYATSLVIFATYREWSQLYPTIQDSPSYYTAPVRHDICVLPNSGFMENGKRYITVVDSAWFGGLNIRHLSEDFIKARVYDAMYWRSVDFHPNLGDKPLHVFTQPMSQGSSGVEVTWLQKVLAYEGLLPLDCVIGTFGPRTYAAVKALQNKYADQILKPIGLSVGTGVVGSATLAWLNKNYS